jgi:hypothetical protein
MYLFLFDCLVNEVSYWGGLLCGGSRGFTEATRSVVAID